MAQRNLTFAAQEEALRKELHLLQARIQREGGSLMTAVSELLALKLRKDECPVSVVLPIATAFQSQGYVYDCSGDAPIRALMCLRISIG